jgi:hypothetical protein
MNGDMFNQSGGEAIRLIIRQREDREVQMLRLETVIRVRRF